MTSSKLGFALFSLMLATVVGCGGSSEDASVDQEGALKTSASATYTCKPVKPIEISLDGQQGETAVTLKISGATALLEGMEGTKKSSTKTETVYEDFKPTPGHPGFFVADTTRLTIDASLAKGGSSGKATFETITNDDGEPTDPENGGAHAPSTIRNTQHLDCSK